MPAGTVPTPCKPCKPDARRVLGSATEPVLLTEDLFPPAPANALPLGVTLLCCVEGRRACCWGEVKLLLLPGAPLSNKLRVLGRTPPLIAASMAWVGEAAGTCAVCKPGADPALDRRRVEAAGAKADRRRAAGLVPVYEPALHPVGRLSLLFLPSSSSSDELEAEEEEEELPDEDEDELLLRPMRARFFALLAALSRIAFVSATSPLLLSLSESTPEKSR